MPSKKKATGWTKADLIITPKSDEETRTASSLRTNMAMAACWSVNWLEKQGLPWDFKEIRSKHWQGLSVGKRRAVGHLKFAFHQIALARKFWAQKNLERTANMMFAAGASLGMAGVYLSPSRKSASETYRSATRRKHELILKQYDKVSSAHPEMSEKEKHAKTMAACPKEHHISLSRLRALRHKRALKPKT